MQQSRGIEDVNLHGLNKHQAKVLIDSRLKRAGPGVYRLRVIHGYSRGTQLRDMIRCEYKNHPKVLRLEVGLNPGATELVLREF